MYRLPKEFALKWIEALEIDNYRQVSEKLLFRDKDDNSSYCCLGVACKIVGVEDESMLSVGTIPNGRPFLAVPKEIKGYLDNNDLVNQLVDLNNKQGQDFKYIAQWIKDNCEFYEQ